MIVVALVVLWLAIFVFLMAYLWMSPKGKRWIVILSRSRKVWIALVLFVVTFGAIVAAYVMIPSREQERTNARKIFEDYSRAAILKLQEQGALNIDSSCSLENPAPELAYVLPSILNVYNKVIPKGSVPRLIRLDDTLQISFDGYKQFKNRGILITRGVRKKIGPRYPLRIKSLGTNHQLLVAYQGNPWDNEQMCGLPAMEAAIREGVDPALLMSVIRHVSNFEFDYVGENRNRGLMSLDSGENLEQLFMAAKMLREADSLYENEEEVVGSMFPDRESVGAGTEWRHGSMKKSWVKQVLADVEFYRNNGLVWENP